MDLKILMQLMNASEKLVETENEAFFLFKELDAKDRKILKALTLTVENMLLVEGERIHAFWSDFHKKEAEKIKKIREHLKTENDA